MSAGKPIDASRFVLLGDLLMPAFQALTLNGQPVTCYRLPLAAPNQFLEFELHITNVDGHSPSLAGVPPGVPLQ